ncbi:uncharacterized protein LOC122498683 [Leptopilina heterotoma]|uniref:uncharacterized protein LOC122498683 n=1 Tax=Leptopilina heterotoma TaxID=63436 RepID=UPI001CA8B758|nr:uncharacterized protein LOC122498683 [Leptopilina heterotoma]
MFMSSLVFRNTLQLKYASTGTSVFKNLLEKCVIRRPHSQVIQQNSRSFFTSSQRQIKFTRWKKASKVEEKCQKAEMDYSNKILNNVLIFNFERPVAYTVVISFAFIQLFGMYSMVTNIYDTYCQDLFDKAKSWKEKINEHPISLLTIAIGCIFGPMIFVLIVFFAGRTIRRIILHKGGKEVTFVTYHLNPRRQVFTESLENMSCKASRKYRNTLPLNIKGKRFYYFIDTDGEILNENLFDFTVGVKRELDKD